MKQGIQVLVLMSGLGLIDVQRIHMSEDTFTHTVSIPTGYSENSTVKTENPYWENRTCSNFNSNLENKTTYLPSEVMILTCGCNESHTPEAIPVACPNWEILDDVENLNISENFTLNTSTSCLSTLKVKIKQESFGDLLYISIMAYCSVDAVPARKPKLQSFYFRKAKDQQECKHDVDCFTKYQLCQPSEKNKMICSCPEDRPILTYRGGNFECTAGSNPGEYCDTTAECRMKENNSYCAFGSCDCSFPYERSGNYCISTGKVQETKSNTLQWIGVGVTAFAFVCLVGGLLKRFTSCMKKPSNDTGNNRGSADSSYELPSPSTVDSPPSNNESLRNNEVRPKVDSSFAPPSEEPKAFKSENSLPARY